MVHVLFMTAGVMLCLLGILCLVGGGAEALGIGAFFLAVGVLILALRYKKWKAWYDKNSMPKMAKEKKSLREAISDAAYKAEMERLPVSSKIIGTSTKTKTGSAAGRMLVGDAVAGLGGAMVGIASAKNTEMTKFLVKYADGHTDVETVKDGSARFKELIAVLEK